MRPIRGDDVAGVFGRCGSICRVDVVSSSWIKAICTHSTRSCTVLSMRSVCSVFVLVSSVVSIIILVLKVGDGVNAMSYFDKVEVIKGSRKRVRYVKNVALYR